MRSKQMLFIFCLQNLSHNSVFSIDQDVMLLDTSCKRKNVSNLWSVDCNWSSKKIDFFSNSCDEDFTLKSAYLKSFLHSMKLGTIVLRAQWPIKMLSWNKKQIIYLPSYLYTLV